MSGFPYTYISAWRKHYNIRRTPNFNKRNYTIAELDDMKINTKTCPFCNEKLIIKTINDQVKSQYLFINRPLKLILLVHRRCKPKASQPEIYQKILKIIELRKLENK